MTEPSPAPPWQQSLRARGYRLTPQRQLVLEAVTELGHATPEEVGEVVRRTASTVNISTVYRTLELLEELGLVTHTHLGHGPTTFHAVTATDHVHLVCRDCSSVTEVPTETVDDLVRRLVDEHGFRPDVRHLAIFGTCRDCTATSDTAGHAQVTGAGSA